LDWSKGRDVSSWAVSKVSAAREARRLKEKQRREDERRAVKMFAALDGAERDEFLKEIGSDDLVFRKLFDQGASDGSDVSVCGLDKAMDEL
jgi:hypothetical protein